MSLLTTLIVIGSVGWGWSRPILPLPYQLLYLSPDPYGYHIAESPQPLLTNRVSDEPMESLEDDSDDKSYEVTQFHTEDQAGRIVYGFHSPDQVRMETRDPDGTVKGSYSYVDPNGNIVRMQYWDDGYGIHMAGNNLPVAVQQEPEYTPEVRAAREEHFRLYAAALATLKAAGLDEPDPDQDRYPSGDYEDDANPQSSEEVAEEEAPPSEDDTVVVENEREPYPEFQKVPISQERPVSLPQADDSEDDESIAVENPELARTNRERMGKSHELPREGNHKLSMETSNSDHVESRVVKPDEPQEDKTTLKKDSGDISKGNPSKSDSSKPTDKKESPATDEVQQLQAERRSLTEEKVEDVPEARAFFYHFAHQVPQRVERIDDDITKTEHQTDTDRTEQIHGASPQGNVPLEAAPQETASFESKPIKSALVPEASKPSLEAASVESKPLKSLMPLQQSISTRAVGLGAIPIAAVHDAQVSPLQRPFLPNFHLRPVYIPPILN